MVKDGGRRAVMGLARMVERGVVGLVLKNGEGQRLGDLELIGHGEGEA